MTGGEREILHFVQDDRRERGGSFTSFRMTGGKGGGRSFTSFRMTGEGKGGSFAFGSG